MELGIKDLQDLDKNNNSKKKSASSSNGDQGGLSTREGEVSNSDNSTEVVVKSNLTHALKSNLNNEEISHANDTIVSNDNSSSAIDESIDNLRKITSKSHNKKSSISHQGGQSSKKLSKKSKSS